MTFRKEQEMNRKKKLGERIITTITALLLAFMLIPAARTMAYPFGYTESGGAFWFNGSNYYYSMILQKYTDNYVRMNVTTFNPTDDLVMFVAEVWASNGTLAGSVKSCIKTYISSTGNKYSTNYVKEWGYSHCYLRMYSNQNYSSGSCLGQWYPDNTY